MIQGISHRASTKETINRKILKFIQQKKVNKFEH